MYSYLELTLIMDNNYFNPKLCELKFKNIYNCLLKCNSFCYTQKQKQTSL